MDRNLAIYSPWDCNSWNHHHHVPKKFIKEVVTSRKSQKLSKAKLSERLTDDGMFAYVHRYMQNWNI